ncbi:hypothetical protein GCM10027299_30710 [Larkinella ripae]
MKKLLIASLVGLTLLGFSDSTTVLGMTPTASLRQTVPQDTLRKDTSRQRQTDRMRRGQIDDRRPTGDPNPKQLRPDSLRRGGAMKVDTIRR